MTLIEILQAQGLTEEQIQRITAAMKENKVFTASEENLDIRYSKLKTDHEGLTKQYGEAQTLIENLKKDKKLDEATQQKITEYEGQITTLTDELNQTRIDNAIQVALLSAKCKDVDYLTYKINSKMEKLELDDNGNVKGLEDVIAGLKTSLPDQFENEKKTEKKIEENKLPEGNRTGTVTREEFLKMNYAERLKLKEENPELYKNVSRQ